MPARPLRLTLEMTRDVAVRDATFEAVHRRFGDRGTVELVAIIATCAMVSRFLVALRIEPETCRRSRPGRLNGSASPGPPTPSRGA